MNEKYPLREPAQTYRASNTQIIDGGGWFTPKKIILPSPANNHLFDFFLSNWSHPTENKYYYHHLFNSFIQRSLIGSHK